MLFTPGTSDSVPGAQPPTSPMASGQVDSRDEDFGRALKGDNGPVRPTDASRALRNGGFCLAESEVKDSEIEILYSELSIEESEALL